MLVIRVNAPILQPQLYGALQERCLVAIPQFLEGGQPPVPLAVGESPGQEEGILSKGVTCISCPCNDGVQQRWKSSASCRKRAC